MERHSFSQLYSNLSGNCPLKKESLISKLIGSNTIDLSNFRSLVGMLKGPDQMLYWSLKESIMSSISSFVTGYRNNDWGLVFLSSH